MKERVPISLLAMAFAVILVSVCKIACAVEIKIPQNPIGQAISGVRTGRTLIERTQAAERLTELTVWVDPARIDDGTLDQIISLLNTPEDPVRGWVAAALGNLGPRASAAAPELLKILPEVDCRMGLSSAGAIRVALKKMGTTPPPEPKCWPGERRSTPWGNYGPPTGSESKATELLKSTWPEKREGAKKGNKEPLS